MSECQLDVILCFRGGGEAADQAERKTRSSETKGA